MEETSVDNRIVHLLIRLSYKYSKRNTEEMERAHLGVAISLLNSAILIKEESDKKKLLQRAIDISRL